MERYRSIVKRDKQKGITQPLLLLSKYLQKVPFIQGLVLAFVITLTILATAPSVFSQVLDEGCTASVLNRDVTDKPGWFVSYRECTGPFRRLSCAGSL